MSTPSPTEIAARTYVAAWQEPDPAARARMIEACFAEDGRIVTRSREIRGRAALAAEMDAVFADPRGLSVRLASAIDADGSTFRFRGLAVQRDGTILPEAFGVDQAGVEGLGQDGAVTT